MKYKSIVYGEAAGSVAGLVYSHNRGGQYVRARVVPVNPNTAFQQAIRGFLATIVAAWNTVLSSEQRALWEAYADAVEIPDILGEPRNAGGIGHFVRSNVPRLQEGFARIDEPPEVFALPTFTPPVLTAAETTQLVSVAFTQADSWAHEVGGCLYVYVSRPTNPSINYFKAPYRFGDGIRGALVPPTTPATFTAPFPFLQGQRLHWFVRAGRADGGLSSPFRGRFLAGA